MVVPVSAGDTSAYLALAVRVAREAGALIARTFHTPATDSYDRKSLTDPVTDTDRAVERFVHSEIRKSFPSHNFIGEESAATEQWTDHPTWICDPIDGTANFSSFTPILPFSCNISSIEIDPKFFAAIAPSFNYGN